MSAYDYDDRYPTCVATYATFRIYSTTLHPDLITAALGFAPSRAFAKGDTFGKAQRIREMTGRLYATEGIVSSRDTRRHLDHILQRLEGKGRALDDLRAEGCDIDIMSYWLSVGHGGPVIEPGQMRQLAELKLPVSWDVYVKADGDDL